MCVSRSIHLYIKHQEFYIFYPSFSVIWVGVSSSSSSSR